MFCIINFIITTCSNDDNIRLTVSKIFHSTIIMGPGYDYHGLMITPQPYTAYQIHAYNMYIHKIYAEYAEAES